MIEKLRVIYASVNLETEFRKMQGWLLGNKCRRKTLRGANKFITGWLNRALDTQPKQDMRALAEDAWVELRACLRSARSPTDERTIRFVAAYGGMRGLGGRSSYDLDRMHPQFIAAYK